MKVAVLHPDLGLGGAERLVVDAAAELAARGHEVVVYTGHHDEGRCFAETVGGAGGFEVRVRGAWFPRAVGGRFVAPCAFARGCLLAIAAAREGTWDCALVDQVAPAIVPLRFLAPATRVLFYCHFPDLLLSERGGWLKRLYRAPLDLWEEATTGLAHALLVNSLFTRGVYRETFRALALAGLGEPEVLYPAVALPDATGLRGVAEAAEDAAPEFLSINRFERKKGIGLAVEALALLHERLREEPGGGGGGGPAADGEEVPRKTRGYRGWCWQGAMTRAWPRTWSTSKSSRPRRGSWGLTASSRTSLPSLTPNGRISLGAAALCCILRSGSTLGSYP